MSDHPPDLSTSPSSPSSFDSVDSFDELPYAAPRRPWRDVVAGLAESLDLTPARLALGVVALVVGGLVAWRLLAPAPQPAEMSLPYTSTSAGPSGSPGSPGSSVPGAPGSPDPTSGPDTSGPGTEVVVHIAGAVTSPGVQHLGPGSRVVDAVDRAGGAAADADLARVNLAAPLQDGQQVYVPRVGEPMPAAAGPAPPGAAGAAGPGGASEPGGAGGAPAGPVNLNTATAEELDTLPGVGPATAAAILAYRQEHGPFTSVDQLLDVRGIGDAKLAELRDLVAV